ncbi:MULTISPECIES: hypothetical protein [unclassified Mesobacillus]|uniref:hypothetical protein n=1 Tax=unclassified Mesobacillus TaxID=2675270 RepID=UPI00203D458D|nr:MULTISPECIES: hypothetical protein [unclassified Mesobacillus]MCM3123158.1 hypothetical protein [Mesobacillus sp. MER 33]MCM3233359.1 hypothetical protein [Mesobacillus sp. MER 48]
MKYWLASIVLIVVSVLFLKQGMELWNLGTDVDGAGIGIHFLGFEINDSVPEASIPSYAIGFFIAAGLSIGLMLVIFGRKNGRVKTRGIFANGRKSSSD